MRPRPKPRKLDAEQGLKTQEENRVPATYDDANLVMQIVRWGTEMGLSDAVVSCLLTSSTPRRPAPMIRPC